MPKKQNTDDDACYNNEQTILLKKEIKNLKKSLKNENNNDMIVKIKEMIKTKEDEFDAIQFSLFAKDMENNKHITLHKPRQTS
jgi:hypothetical protein